MDLRTAALRMEAIGRLGITISICCGPCGSHPFRWSVHAMNDRGQEFDVPFAAQSFEHAMEIAETEIVARGWYRAPVDRRGSEGLAVL